MTWSISPIGDSLSAEPLSYMRQASSVPIATLKLIETGGSERARPSAVADHASSAEAANPVSQQIALLVQAQRMGNEAVSAAQTAQAALQDIGGLLSRMQTLAVRAAAATTSPAQRIDVDIQYRALIAHLQSVVENTHYNDTPLLNGTRAEITLGSDATGAVRLGLPNAQAATFVLIQGGVDTPWATSKALMAIDNAIADVGKMRVQLREHTLSLQAATIRTLDQQVDLSGADDQTADVAYAIATNALAGTRTQERAAHLVAVVANQMPTAALALLYFNGAASGGR